MFDIANPHYAPLLAKYRAWVKAQNDRLAKGVTYDLEDCYCKLYRIFMSPDRRDSEMRQPLTPTRMTPTRYEATYQGFLDWCVREGIGISKEDE
jgi:hypothetical protein